MTNRPMRMGDVARRAGVSPSTVSRVFSAPDMVSPDTREAVLEAARELGWRRHALASNLRLGRTGLVLALTPNVANAYHASVLVGLADTLRGAGLSLLVAGADDLSRALDPRRWDGLAVLDTDLARRLAGMGAAFRDRAVVLTEPRPGRGPDDPEADPFAEAVVVRNDDAPGAALAAAHLHDLGHRRIGHLCGMWRHGPSLRREAALRAALAGYGLDLPERWVLGGAYSYAAGRAAAERWLAMPAWERPTGLVCGSDSLAVGFLAAIHAAGLNAPEDVSVVGFDDVEIAAAYRVPLTTIRQPRRDLGRHAAEAMLARIERRAVPDLSLPVTLVVRASTGPAPETPAPGRSGAA